MSTAKFDTWLNSDGTTNYKCRAWVNFNGTGTVAIRAAGNVSSITDNGTGDYTVNFTTALPDTNFVFTGNVGGPADTTATGIRSFYHTARTTSSCRCVIATPAFDFDTCNVAIFR